jgi:hypothetical protein
MLAGAAGELAAGRDVAIDGLRDLVEILAEHVVQQKRRALQRRQPFQRHHQRQRDVVGLLGLVHLDHRFGHPWSDICLALHACGFQVIKAEPRHGLGQERPRVGHRRAIRPVPAQIRVLHDVIGFRDRAQHAVGDAGQSRTQRRKGRCCVVRRLRHAWNLRDARSGG